MALDTRKVINGTHGSLWINDQEVSEVKSFQVKAEFQKEEVKIAGQMATDTKYMGYSIKGSLSFPAFILSDINLIILELTLCKDKEPFIE